MSIHPYDVKELKLKEASVHLSIETETLRKQIESGLWKGVFYKAGNEWRTSLHLIYEGQKQKALADS